MEATGVPSPSGFKSLEAACSSPPPHASRGPPSSYSAARDAPPLLTPLAATGVRLQPAAAAAAVPPKSGRPIEAKGVLSSSGFRISEAACSSPPPDALQAPPSSSATALEPPPLRSSMALAEPSASPEGSEQRDLKIEVHLMIGAGMETVMATFRPSQTVKDIKELFEKNEGKYVCSAENMVIYHDGATLSNMTQVGTLDLETWNSILITSVEDPSLPTSDSLAIHEVMVDDGFTVPMDFFQLESTNEDLPLSFQEDEENTVNCYDYTAPHDHDYRSILGQSAYIAEGSTTAIAENSTGTAGTASYNDETVPAIADNQSDCVTPCCMPGQGDIVKSSSATNETAPPTVETAPAVAETSSIQADKSLPSHIFVGRVLTPASPADFVDQPLSDSDLHGFNTVNEVLSDINAGPPGWIRKNHALALLYNGAIFSIDGEVQECDKQDGLIWVINSTKSRISNTIKGCKAAANEESSEHFIGTMKENGVEIEWFEVRGKVWSRRRLVLKASDGVFQVLQWKQHQKRETDVGPATTSGEREQPARGLAEENSAGGHTGFEEMRNLIQGLQATVSAQLKEFETTVSTRLSQFESHIQSIDTRLQAIEQERAR